ncbi:class Ib ribonucleoside-diphosphate reductase assembly flavoprotein NrdI [uncultured Metabacillus sp.]|uniref:class Ib ribonucleoside-diphosphate reductase assembly flavoprotein NrdI n=1 Tax=uncultured Metabacillus sp. TaxID=2860135 RepID=UPI00262A1952|nr:class Ib ribonucleoside-diphosphate reductase assembly flavoprotein NrdI [uncultured Metabacillus sp.]
MRIVYLSLSGNIRKFINDGGIEATEISYSNPLIEINEDFVLIVPSYDQEITDLMSEFIEYENNEENLVAIVGSGSRNFNDGFCFNAKDLSEKYNKPLIFKFEFSGTEDDIINFKKEVELIEITRTK